MQPLNLHTNWTTQWGPANHVFDPELITQMAAHVGITTLQEGATPTDFIYLGRTPAA